MKKICTAKATSVWTPRVLLAPFLSSMKINLAQTCAINEAILFSVFIWKDFLVLGYLGVSKTLHPIALSVFTLRIDILSVFQMS
jgi:hypothetical protein